MGKRTTSDICNVAIVGHGGVGKTTFVDHLLHDVGFAKRAGEVDAGSSLSDTDPEEKERHFSVNGTVFHFQAHGRSFNLIDTPGYPEFIGAALAALPVVETAVIAVNAHDGIQLNTRRMWSAAAEHGLARVLLITRLDSDNIDFEGLLADLQETFGAECRPVFLPIGLGKEVKGIVNLLAGGPAPDGVVGDFESAGQALRETIIECDDALMERYLEGGEISRDELLATLGKALATGALVPVLCCAAKADIGVKEAAQFLASCCPSPAAGAVRTATGADGAQVELKADPAGPFCARVFKAATDVHVGKVAYFRVYSGGLSQDLTVGLARTGKSVRLGHIFVVKGAEQEEVHEAVPGDILAVTKVEELQLDDTLCPPVRVLTLPPMKFPRPMTALAVEPQSREDDQKIGVGLHDLAASDRTLTVHRDEQSSELVVTGMSTLHLSVVLAKLKRRYDVSVVTREPSIHYRETITKTAESHYKHKKQTGGRGQYGDVYMRLEPAERGSGFEFLDEIVGGVIPRQYLPAIEKGIIEVMHKGLLAGYPIVDMKAAATYGSYHSVDSSEAAFKIAGSRAFQEGFEAARPVLLEPIANMEVTIPVQYMGDVMGNLTGHRGRILGMDQVGTLQILKAEIPMAEVTGYSTELKSMTGGEGSFTLEFARYEPVPAHIQEEVIARRKHKKEEGEEED